MKLKLKSSIQITLLYLAIGLVWIVLSDYTVIYLTGAEGGVKTSTYQLIKGSFYVIFTSALLFVLIEKHSRRLRRKIEETEALNKQLEQYAQELEYINQELQQFSYITSHDLQEPLRNITSFLKRLEQKCGRSIDEKGRIYIHYAIEGSNRMRRLIRDALALHQFRERDELELHAVSLNQTVQESLILLRKQMEHKEAYIIIKLLPELRSNESLLIQLFHILIGNSLIYHREGIPPAIEVFAEEHKHYWDIFVRDNGIGIAKWQKENIFQVFRRLHPQDEYTESGTGVGLALARKIVQRLGGNIKLAEHPEEQPGCTFSFSLPKQLENYP